MILSNTVDKLVQNEEQQHWQWLNDTLTRNGLEKGEVHIHFHNGDAKNLIPQIVNNSKADF